MGEARNLRQAAHRAIKEVGEDYAEFHFNTALSKLMELTNALGAARDDGLAGTDAYAEAVETLLLLLAPMAPHIAEELWARRGKPYSIHQQAWPSFDPELVVAEMIELPVQVDGKLRDKLTVAPDTAPEEIERQALASERVQAYLKGRAPRKVVQIPGRLVNIVTPGD
jgi:leucyl-tRNA synthetase